MLIGTTVDDNSTKENHFQTNEKFDCKVDDAIIGMDDCQFVTSLALMIVFRHFSQTNVYYIVNYGNNGQVTADMKKGQDCLRIRFDDAIISRTKS